MEVRPRSSVWQCWLLREVVHVEVGLEQIASRIRATLRVRLARVVLAERDRRVVAVAAAEDRRVRVALEAEDTAHLATARDLLRKSGTSPGYARLTAEGRLDLSMEALVIDPEFAELFKAEEIAIARTRLNALGYRPPA